MNKHDLLNECTKAVLRRWATSLKIKEVNEDGTPYSYVGTSPYMDAEVVMNELISRGLLTLDE
jgi:hypothetical protein